METAGVQPDCHIVTLPATVGAMVGYDLTRGYDPRGMHAMTLTSLLDQWEQEIFGQTMLRPSTVQNRLLQVHDTVEGLNRAAVEGWLAGSVDRYMYSFDEVSEMIASLRRDHGAVAVS